MKKEQIKPNKVITPTLFIGLGGTGSKVIKKVAEMCCPEERKHISFVCLDTDVNDLQTIEDSSAHMFYVQTSSTQTVGRYLDYDTDASQNWFPKNAVMYGKSVSEGAGQVRAISRLALNDTIKTGRIEPLHQAIKELFYKSGNNWQQEVHVIVASSASGGTGSGMILPICMYIRDYVKTNYNTDVMIRALLMLPGIFESVISSYQETKSQFRNAYATVKEINAFMMQGSKFFGLCDDLKRFSEIKVDYKSPDGEDKSLALLPMDFCFLMDGLDAQNGKKPNLSQYIEQAALALYEQNIGPMHTQVSSTEDNIIMIIAEKNNVGRNRFGGTGTSILRYPYEDIADYIAYNWAWDSIGGEASNWGKYDKDYELQAAEDRKKGIPVTESQSRSEVYTSKLYSDKTPFAEDIKNMYLQDADDRVEDFLAAVNEQVLSAVKTNSKIKDCRNKVQDIVQGHYDKKNKNFQAGLASNEFGYLHQYEINARDYVETLAQNEADSIFYVDILTTDDQKDFTVEGFLKNGRGEMPHPVAARYLLYKARDAFAEACSDMEQKCKNAQRSLRLFSDGGDASNDSKSFDAKYTRGHEETSLRELCDAEKEPTIWEKFGGYDHIYEQLNLHMPAYHTAIDHYVEYTAGYYAYKKGYQYLSELCGIYEEFFDTFPAKVASLGRMKDDLRDGLQYKFGDSVQNVCVEPVVLEELLRFTSNQGSESSLSDNEMNIDIFNAVKSNVSCRREMRLLGVVEANRWTDIFDETMLGYFKKSVREKCDSIDLNIIQALDLECTLRSRSEAREEQDSDEELFDKISIEDRGNYIKKRLIEGINLASPNIQKLSYEESREVNCVAYHKSLNQMTNYRISDLIKDGFREAPCDSISKYEMHFYIASYNLTPDKLENFKSPKVTETEGNTEAGAYCKAYMDYAKYLGPDSTKNMMISTHIDRRWDSIAFMPEIDFDFMADQMMKIHIALIYALVYKYIRLKNVTGAANGKEIYRYWDSRKKYQDMIVSNGTPCDQFYEVLDSLYIDAAVVEDIGKRVDKIHDDEMNSNPEYEETKFAASVRQFKLLHIEEEHSSLLEIPLAYYKSLPGQRRDEAEISALVDAVIEVFRDEMNLVMNEKETESQLCEVLFDQFELMMDNYEADNTGLLNMNKNASDNLVIDVINSKLSTAMNEFEYVNNVKDLTDRMEARIKRSRINKDDTNPMEDSE